MPVETFTDISAQGSAGGLSEIQRGVTSSIRFPAYGEDPATFSGIPKVTVTRDSDEAKVLEEVEAAEVAATEDDIAHFVVDIKGDEVPEVDLLTAVWSDGATSVTTYTEVVGGFVTSLRSISKKLGTDTVAPEPEVAMEREIALRDIEGACGVAFRNRYSREALDGPGTTDLLLSHPQAVKLLSVTVAGEEMDLDGLRVTAQGIVSGSANWPVGSGNIVVAYVHGYGSFPQAASPVRDLAAFRLTPAPSDVEERATSVTTDIGTYSIVLPGVRGARFPLPSVNAFVEDNAYVTVA